VRRQENAAPDGSAAQLAELFFLLGRRIRQRAARNLAPIGLTPAQARALRVIAHSDQPLRIVALAAELDIVPRSATAVADALERAGLVTRTPDPSDRRSVLVSLSEQGRERMDQMRRQRQQAAEDLFLYLPESDREHLARILRALHAAAATDPS
jgi:DNA-binding MarR family transcriptional regulator